MKEYPIRKTDSEIVDICECGHEKFWHNIDNGIERGACISCTCPKYKYEQQLKKYEAKELWNKIYLDNRSKGFSQ